MTQFWTPQYLSITVSSGEDERCWNLSQPYALLGSHRKCDVVIDDSSVSSRALLILATRHGIRCVVLSTGAKKAGRLIQVVPSQPLKLHGKEVVVELLGNGQDLSLDAAPSDETVYCLTWKDDTCRQYVQLADGSPVLLGRKQPAHIIVDDPRLSGLHCCVFRQGDQMWVFDLASANGTYISGQRVNCSSVPLEKSLQIGRHRFHFLRLHTDHVPTTIAKQRDGIEAELLAQQAISNDLQQQRASLSTALLAFNAASVEARKNADMLRSELTEQVTELEMQIANQAIEVEQLRSEQSVKETLLEQSAQSLAKLEQDISVLVQQRNELKQQLETEWITSAKKTEELKQAETTAQERERLVARLQDELHEQQNVLNSLERDRTSADVNDAVPLSVEDDSCILTSFDFHAALAEALAALPAVDDQSEDDN